ncbi:probable glycerol-3-phosphate acyltransferase 2 isoform X2 [Prosopis cineraria]|uniref:probable glycerol-3-phosphate acyltransferase 2 isoform X2 n=1 Tax=Prosopis cineraria TaxID=364024 RepID=UPI00240F1B73|nr:probable glycerol-3-phosphate acyltransferase 2 isoform X2 [Prosopis cineraria]
MFYHYTENAESAMETISLVHETGKLSKRVLVFDFQGTMLRSASLFPYFALVAFEAGGLLRYLLLLLSYPLVWLVGEESQVGLNIMVFLTFFGIKKDTFRIGSSVLPKFFLQDVGRPGFEAVQSFERKVATSKMPRVMVECVLKEYLGVDAVVAREIKSFHGYYLGLLHEEKKHNKSLLDSSNIVGIGRQTMNADQEEVYLASDAEKTTWEVLPRERYPKPVIFHDGRLALRPTPLSSLALFMWLPLGLVLCMLRFTVGISLPFNVSGPILSFLGARTTLSKSHYPQYLNKEIEQRGTLYVCNHRTLLDPLYISYVINKPLSAVTYSLSRFNELVSPIRTIRLTRDREKDSETMGKMLSSGSLVVCPEGTTCREPYLLRFSPLFAELTDDIVPVAVDVQVNMFYGTTASGNKALDPFYYFLNPKPNYCVKILARLQPCNTCKAGGKSRIEVANYVQSQIGKALGFACTSFTRKDKYMTLVGHDGVCKRPSGEPGH